MPEFAESDLSAALYRVIEHFKQEPRTSSPARFRYRFISFFYFRKIANSLKRLNKEFGRRKSRRPSPPTCTISGSPYYYDSPFKSSMSFAGMRDTFDLVRLGSDERLFEDLAIYEKLLGQPIYNRFSVSVESVVSIDSDVGSVHLDA